VCCADGVLLFVLDAIRTALPIYGKYLVAVLHRSQQYTQRRTRIRIADGHFAINKRCSNGTEQTKRLKEDCEQGKLNRTRVVGAST
jgi:hypothetical protein